MGACVQCVLYLISLFLVGVIPKNLHSNAAIGVETVRIRRQAGYVYDRPSLSFNLPSRTTVGSTPTQATTVDRTSAQQMYYAYPAPAGGSTGNVGYSNTGSSGATSTATSGAAGYNYGAAIQNTATVSTGSTGGGTVNIGYSSSGATGATSGTSGGSTGYNYGGVMQNTGSVSTGGTTSTATSGSGGYNYQVQNTGLQTIANSGSTGYSGSSSGSNSVVSTGSVSTKAPEYLPPTNTGGGNVGVSTNVQTGSGTARAMPSDVYIPQQTPSVTVTQTGSNVSPSAGVVTQTSTVPASTPNTSYLVPNTGSQTSNVQNTQTQVTVSSSGSGPSVPNQDYLPPVITSSGTAGQGYSTPAAKYLPPVFK